MCDLVLVCVKSYDIVDAARLIRSAVGAQTVILSLQNGVENEEWLEDTLGSANVLGGMVYIGAELISPGVVEHSFSGALVFGEQDGQRTPRAERLEWVFLDADIQAQLSSSITLMLWDKLVWNAAFNAIAVLTRSTVGELLASPLTRALVRDTMLEVVAVAQAQGLKRNRARTNTSKEVKLQL